MSTLTRTVYVYSSGPIDHWDGWTPMSEFLRGLVGLELANKAPFTVAAFLAFTLKAAHAIAKEPGYYWEGDVRGSFGELSMQDYEENMYVALPSGDFPRNLSELSIAWKQDNNGSTFLVSNRPLAIQDDEEYDASAPTV